MLACSLVLSGRVGIGFVFVFGLGLSGLDLGMPWWSKRRLLAFEEQRPGSVMEGKKGLGTSLNRV